MSQVHVREAGNTEDLADAVIKDKPQRKWQSYIWDSLDKSPEERRFLLKLDGVLLTFASLGNLIFGHPSQRDSDFAGRIFYQIPGPIKCEQCVCLWNVCYCLRAKKTLAWLMFVYSGRKIWAFTATS